MLVFGHSIIKGNFLKGATTMEEMITRYIFKNLRINEKRLDAISNALVKQCKINKKINNNQCFIMIELVLIARKIYSQDKRIAELEQEIKELRSSEEE
jgi:hypothetical protein